MTDRIGQGADFLKAAGWNKALRISLADDASFRRYERIVKGEGNEQQRAVLMDAPPAFEDVRPYVAIARYLKNIDLAAPEIMAEDLELGFLLLEDMGDDLLARVIERHSDREQALYRLAVAGLIRLHRSNPPQKLTVTQDITHNLPYYDEALLLPEAALFVDWYFPALTGKPLHDEARQDFLNIWREILTPVVSNLNHLVLRDYHAENLMLRQGEKELGQLGLLDFQDAVIGHPAYDLASLLQDARRDVSPELEQEMISLYLSETKRDKDMFQRDYSLLAAQRNTKIIGIFSRLFLRDGKAAYLKLIPRVWGLLRRDLEHPALAPIKDWIAEYIPPEWDAEKSSPQSPLPRQAMILAAGLGTRMRPLTDHCPKPLVTVAGKEILSHSLEGLCAAGVRNVVINMHYFADQLEDFVRTYYDHRLTLRLSDERQKLMDSGGGVKKTLEKLAPEPFFVLNSDIIWRDGGRPMIQRMQSFWRDDMDIMMLLVPLSSAFGYEGAGDYCMKEGGELRHRRTDDQADYVYGGVMIIRPECFTDTPDGPFSLRLLFDRAEEKGRLFGMFHDGEWYHVGTAEARNRLEDILIQGD